MKKYKVVVTKEEHKASWNKAGINNFAYGLADIVSFITAGIMFSYKLYLFAILFILMSLMFNTLFFSKIHKELYAKGIIQEV